jgi:hypothetical protein
MRFRFVRALTRRASIILRLYPILGSGPATWNCAERITPNGPTLPFENEPLQTCPLSRFRILAAVVDSIME